MGRVPMSAPGPWRGVAAVLAAGLALAACGTAVSVTPILGVPSASITVPLQLVACTSTNSCVAIGSSGSDVGPSTIGEWRRVDGAWSALDVPTAASSQLNSAACWTNGCLIGGTQTTGDLLWVYDASTRSVSTSPAPHASRSVNALSCFANLSCGAIDSTGITDNSRLSFTADGGATWTAPLPMAWATGDSVTALSCTDALNCLAAAVGTAGQAVLEVTHDEGSSWSALDTGTTWNSLSSLTCEGLHCVGLASTASGSAVERTATFGRTWSAVRLSARANALACTSQTRCVLAGQTSARVPWLATLHHRTVGVASLRYVPSPLTDVACGTKVCAAIAVSTVLSLRP